MSESPPSTAPPPRDPVVLERDERSTTRRRLSLAAGVLFAVIMFGSWMYAFFFYDPGLMVDELADRTFPIEAEQVCARAVVQMEALPPANTAEDAAERAGVIEQADAILSAMVADLEPLVPDGQGQVTTGVRTWLSDWETHVADRAAYAAALRTDPDARFLETTKGRRQVSRAIDGFAEVNRMPSCSTPGDVG